MKGHSQVWRNRETSANRPFFIFAVAAHAVMLAVFWRTRVSAPHEVRSFAPPDSRGRLSLRDRWRCRAVACEGGLASQNAVGVFPCLATTARHGAPDARGPGGPLLPQILASAIFIQVGAYQCYFRTSPPKALRSFCCKFVVVMAFWRASPER